MTSPGHGTSPRDEPGAWHDAPGSPEGEPKQRRDWRDLEENPLVGWAKAIALGIADTARDMLEAGRESARQAMDEGWERFDRKTKHRRM
jgi:hypothetical protein